MIHRLTARSCRTGRQTATLLLSAALALTTGARIVLAEEVTLHVPSELPTIQEAIDAANDGDIVLVAPGDYVLDGPLDFNRHHDPGDSTSAPLKNVTLRSVGGPEETTLRLSEATLGEEVPTVQFVNGETEATTLEGFTVVGNVPDRSRFPSGLAPAVHCSGASATIRNSRIRGGITYGVQALLIIEDSSISRSMVAGIGPASSCGEDCGAGVEIRVLRSSINDGWGDGIDIRNDLFTCGVWDSFILRNRGTGIDARSAQPLAVTISGSVIAWNDGGIHSFGRNHVVDHSTIVWNRFVRMTKADVRNSIVLDMGFINQWTVSHSCLNVFWNGGNNIREFPNICGWTGPGDVYIDAAAPPGGDGGPDHPLAALRPLAELRELRNNEWSFALREGSPCIGTAEDGSHMGAVQEVCELSSGLSEVHFAPGDFEGASGEERLLLEGVSLVGAGADQTRVRGIELKLAADDDIRRVTLTDSKVSVGADSEIYDSDFDNTPIVCRGGSIVRIAACRFNRTPRALVFGTGVTGWVMDSHFKEHEVAAQFSGVGPRVAYCVFTRSRTALELFAGATPEFSHLTLHGNGTGLVCHDASPVVEDSIIWGSPGASIVVDGTSSPDVTFSCVQGGWPGEGNIDVDPQYCGWASCEAWVAATPNAAGDGTENNPYGSIAAALDGFRPSLAENSPCIRAASDGLSMGAIEQTGCPNVSACAGQTIHLAPGHFVESVSLYHKASLIGAGVDETAVQGTIAELRGGATVSALTLRGRLTLTANEAASVEAVSIENEYVAPSLDPPPPPTVTCGVGSRSEFRRVTITGGGAAIVGAEDGETRLIRCRVASTGAPAIETGGLLSLRDCTVVNSGYRLERVSTIDPFGPGFSTVAFGFAVSAPEVELVRSRIHYYGPVGGIADNLGGVSGRVVNARDATIDYDSQDFAPPRLSISAGIAHLTNCALFSDVRIGAGSTVNHSYLRWMKTWGRNTKVTNSIIWNPSSPGWVPVPPPDLSTVTHSIVQGGAPGEGNLDVDPRFVSFGLGDLRLTPNSPCIDAGSTEVNLDRDLEGGPRLCGAEVDIGPLESGACEWQDCNQNGFDDRMDIRSGRSEDLDSTGVPDECERLRFVRGTSTATAPSTALRRTSSLWRTFSSSAETSHRVELPPTSTATARCRDRRSISSSSRATSSSAGPNHRRRGRGSAVWGTRQTSCSAANSFRNVRSEIEPWCSAQSGSSADGLSRVSRRSFNVGFFHVFFSKEYL